ncbi:hypothetical protein FXO38_09087, partial [Capsicum annuum]
MHYLKIQPQLLHSLLLAEINNDRDDLFIFSINGKDMYFGNREFCVVSGLKCFKKSDFVFDPKGKNKLMDRYYLDHSVPPITEDEFIVIKNEITNVRRDMSLFLEKIFKEMIEYQKKV